MLKKMSVYVVAVLLVVVMATCSDNEADRQTGLPQQLSISFTRDDPGTPIPAQEVTAFTRKVVGMMARAEYYKWLRRISYGVDASTGKKDWDVWWTGSHAEKSGDTVSFVHGETSSPDSADGGHNLMTRTIKVLGSAISGYFLTGDEDMARLAEQYCKGVTATMEGMVYDENDTLHHLMARNIIPFNHSYTRDGRKTAVDYSNWYHDGAGWNCQRFNYPDNPYWGSVWVTNMRSKDDVSRVMRIAATIRYAAAYADDDAMRSACADTYEHLRLFAKDVVDSGYWIRTKDRNGEPFIPGKTGDAELDSGAGDLASYRMFDNLFPQSQCNATRALAYLAYGEGMDNDCGDIDGSENAYEQTAVHNHYFNIWLIRSHHLARIFQALTNGDGEDARLGLRGLVRRYTASLDTPADRLPVGEDEYMRDLASSMMQAVSVGYPLNEREARLVMKYWLRAVEEWKDWPYWDLWDASVPDGTYGYRPPDTRVIDEDTGEKLRWVRPEDFAAFFDACWSPFKNPDGMRILDCDIVRNPSSWDPAWAD